MSVTNLQAILGCGGSGKSYYINNLIKEDNFYALRTATTGIAALNLGSVRGADEPTTINSALRYFNVESLLRNFHQGKTIFPLKMIDKKYKNIIIDEISLMDSGTLDLIVLAMDQYNNMFNKQLGLLISGDLGQLDPVSGSPVFMSRCWPRFNIKYLTEVKRQENKDFVEALNLIRIGKAKEAVDWFKDNIEFRSNVNLNHRGITLFSTNNEVDIHNRKCIDRLLGESKSYYAKSEGVPHPTWKDIPKRLEVKPGCIIQLLYNSLEQGFANGDAAIVNEVWDNAIHISLLRRKKEIFLRPRKLENFELDFKGHAKKTPIGTLNVIHAKLMYGCTTHKCLTGDSILSSTKGLITLKDINVGDVINTGQKTYSKVLGKVCSGTKDVYEITSKQGYKIKTSLDHKLLTFCNFKLEYKEINNLKIGDVLAISTDKHSFIPYHFNNLDENMGWFLGALIGDGSYKGSKKAINSVNFTSQDISSLNKVETILQNYNVNYQKVSRKNNKATTINFCNKEFRQLLLNLDLQRVSKKDKDIPSVIFNCSDSIRSAFIQALFDTDGHCKKLLLYSSISINLISKLQILLNTFGIISYIKKEKECYKLTVYSGSYKLFYKYIGFSIPYKQVALQNLINKVTTSNIGNIPKEIINYIKKDLYSQNKSIYKKSDLIPGLNYNDLTKNIFKGKNNLTYNKLKNIIDYYNKYNLQTPEILLVLDKNQYFFSEIESIERKGEEALYDIEIENEHTFWCNGFISHNCQGLTLDDVQINLKGEGRNFLSRQSGMLYTALSRVRTPEGLSIVGTPEDLVKCCYVNPTYLKWIK